MKVEERICGCKGRGCVSLVACAAQHAGRCCGARRRRQKRAESRVVGGRPPEPPLRPARSHLLVAFFGFFAFFSPFFAFFAFFRFFSPFFAFFRLFSPFFAFSFVASHLRSQVDVVELEARGQRVPQRSRGTQAETRILDNEEVPEELCEARTRKPHPSTVAGSPAVLPSRPLCRKQQGVSIHVQSQNEREAFPKGGEGNHSGSGVLARGRRGREGRAWGRGSGQCRGEGGRVRSERATAGDRGTRAGARDTFVPRERATIRVPTRPSHQQRVGGCENGCDTPSGECGSWWRRR